jgi:hypothetical protein
MDTLLPYHIPQTLKKLIITAVFPWKVSPLLDSAFDDSLGVPKFCECLPHLTKLRVPADWTVNTPWMLALPDTLEKLIVRDWHASVLLPPNLKSFCCNSATQSPESPFLFPCGLTKLRCADDVSSLPHLIASLPTSLTSVSFGSRTELTLSDIAQLPRGLQKLNFYAMVCAIGPDAYSAWPPNLKMLKTASLALELWKTIPKSVTSFQNNYRFSDRIRVQGFQTRDVDDAWMSLPGSLTDLCLRSASSVLAPTKLPHFPSLTRLVDSSTQLPSDGASEIQKLLSPTLTYLDMESLSYSMWQFLPKNLTHLELQRTRISILFMRYLPKFLRYLSLGGLSTPEEGEPKADTEGSVWQLGSANCLPIFLKFIYILDHGSSEIMNDSFLAQLPATTLELKIPVCLCTFTDSGFSFITHHPLTILNLAHCKSITGACFIHLPKTLQELDVSAMNDVEDQHTQFLPRDLISINIFSATKLTNACLQFLPPRIASIEAGSNANIQASDLPLFPFKYQSTKFYHRFNNQKFSVIRGKLFQ